MRCKARKQIGDEIFRCGKPAFHGGECGNWEKVKEDKIMEIGEQVQISQRSYYGGADHIALVRKGRKYYTIKPWQGIHISIKAVKIPITEIKNQEETKDWDKELLWELIRRQ